MNERTKQLATEVGISVDYLTNTKQIVLLETLKDKCTLRKWLSFKQERKKIRKLKKLQELLNQRNA